MRLPKIARSVGSQLSSRTEIRVVSWFVLFCLRPVRVHILPVRYELVELEVIVVWRFDLVVSDDVVSPRWGK